MPEYRFQRFGEEHVPLMHGWLLQPHVAERWTPAMSAEEIREKYCGPAGIDPYVVYLEDRPFAFMQSYRAMGSGGGWWEDITDPGVVGIDSFIGEPDLLGQGHGAGMVRAFVDRLLADPSVTKVQVDPSPGNAGAIRCYEKVGFVPQRVIDTPDGPALYMLLER